MRVSDNKDDLDGYLHDDSQGLIAGECKGFGKSDCPPVYMGEDEPVYCPKCGKELFYRSYWEW